MEVQASSAVIAHGTTASTPHGPQMVYFRCWQPHLSFHFLLSSRPAHFSNWEQLRMQPPWATSTGASPSKSLDVHWIYRSLQPHAKV